MAEQPDTTVRRPRRRVLRRVLIVSFLIIAAGLAIAYFVCGMTYSEGTRTGILMKVSRKGFVFKTYEGEMNIGGISDGQGTIMPATVFRFSVADDGVYRKLEQHQGARVTVRYKEVIHSFFWQGDTNYFIQEVRPLK